MKKRFFLESLGCARNQVDGNAMTGLLLQAGWQIVEDPAAADMIVVNTCGFIEAAADESIDVILELARMKESAACRRLIVTGCLPERHQESIRDALPEVDIFLGTGALHEISAAAEGFLASSCRLPNPVDCCFPDHLGGWVRPLDHFAYLKIAEGCVRNCTYCIIPKLKGPQRSRPLKTLVSEAASLIQDGVKEIILVAQDTTHYGRDLVEPTDLSVLLQELSELSSDVWFRLLYGHPESIDEKIIQIIAKSPNLLSYYDIPIQHACDDLLRSMGRRSTKNNLRCLFNRIREIDPGAVLRTTVIVGFPGETQEDFDELLDFVEEVRFDHLGVFAYSDADDLPSHRLPNHLSKKTAERRYDELMISQREISLEKNEARVGQVFPVLVDEAVEPGLFAGRGPFQAPEVDGVVDVWDDARAGEQLRIGELIKVRITDAFEYDLMGELA